MKRLVVAAAVTLALVGCGRGARVVKAQVDPEPARAECPTDGTVYGYGSCVVPDDVIEAPATFNVQPDAPSKVCRVIATDVLFECPASYEVPGVVE